MKIDPIWLVEDSAEDIELTVTALEDSNLANRLIVIRDGAEALERLKKLGHPGGEPFPSVTCWTSKCRRWMAPMRCAPSRPTHT